MHSLKNFLDPFIHKIGNKYSHALIDSGKILDWSKKCGTIEAHLHEAETKTEQDFLKLGDNLQDYYTRSQSMSNLSGIIVELMIGQDIINAGADLHATLDDLKKYLHESVSQFEHMHAMYHVYAKDLAKIDPALDAFEQLALNLNILGFLTRVENSHINNQNTGFATLAEDVKKVSQSIKDKVGIIHETCDYISAGVRDTIDEVSAFSLTHITSAQSKLDQALKSETAMINKVEHARGAAHDVNDHITQIGKDISNIVMSQQFHDITRQRMEHVRTVLEHLKTKLQETQGDPSEQTGIMIDTLGLQSAQITHANDEFTGAMGKLIASLHTLAEDVHAIAERIDEVAWVTDKNGTSTLQETRTSIQAIIDYIKVMSSKHNELNDKAREVSAMVATMSTFVHDIHSIGLDLEFLALNARIKAAHLGEEGVALDTISGSVYELSRSTRANTMALTDILNNLANLSEEFTQDIEAQQQDSALTLQHLMEKLIQLTGTLHTIGEQVRSKTQEISRLGVAMEQDVIRTMSTIEVHKRIETALHDAAERMLDMARDGQEAFPHSAGGSATGFLREIDQLYTMHSERDVHTRHTGETAGEEQAAGKQEESSNIEFF